MLQLGLREEYLKSQATVGAHWVRWAKHSNHPKSSANTTQCLVHLWGVPLSLRVGCKFLKTPYNSELLNRGF